MTAGPWEDYGGARAPSADGQAARAPAAMAKLPPASDGPWSDYRSSNAIAEPVPQPVKQPEAEGFLSDPLGDGGKSHYANEGTLKERLARGGLPGALASYVADVPAVGRAAGLVADASNTAAAQTVSVVSGAMRAANDANDFTLPGQLAKRAQDAIAPGVRERGEAILGAVHKEAGEKAAEIQGHYADNSIGHHAMGAAGSAPQMAAALGASLVGTPFAGAAVMGTTTFADSYADALDEGHGKGRAAVSGLVQGILEGGLDYVTLGMAKYGVKPVLDKLTSKLGSAAVEKIVQKLTGNAAARLGTAAAEGALTEVATTAAQMGADKAILDKQYSADDWWKALRDSAIQGGMMSSGVVAAGAAARRAGSLAADPNPVLASGHAIPDPAAGPLSRSVNAGIADGSIPVTVPFPEAAHGSLSDAADHLSQRALPDLQQQGEALQVPDAGKLANQAAMTGQSTMSDGPWNDYTPAVEQKRHDAPPLAAAAHDAATSPNNSLPEPSEAQREAGNFKVGRAKFAGLDLSIEYPAGVKRQESHNKPLTRAYGYFRGTVGKDKDHVDVFIGDRADDPSLPVFVVDQLNARGKFDESKVVIGEPTEAAAREAYLSNYPDGWNGLGAITRMTQDEFKTWVRDPKKTSQPVGQLPPARAVAMTAASPTITAPTSGIGLGQAQRLTERLTRKWGSDAPRVVLAQDAQELQRAAGLPPGASIGDRAEGTYRGKPAVFLNIGAIESPQRFRQVLAHEALGHYGIERVVGETEWNAIADVIGQHIREGTGGREVRAAIDHLRSSQPAVLGDPNLAAREVLAVMAEHGSRNGLVHRAVAGARRFLRQHMPGLNWSDTDVRDLLNQAEGVLLRGQSIGPGKYAEDSTKINNPQHFVSDNGVIKRNKTQPFLHGQTADGALAGPWNDYAPATVQGIRDSGIPLSPQPGSPAAAQGTLFSKAADPELAPPSDVSNVAQDFKHLNDAQRAALSKIATFTPRESLADRLHRHGERWQAKVVQGAFDQFAPLKDLDETAYMQARLSKGTDGAVEATFRYGPPKLTDGALDVKADGKGLQGHLQDLGGEHDLFFAWMAGNRAEALKAEGRERLFDDNDIAAMKQLGLGKMADGRPRAGIYAAAQRAFNGYQKHVLDIAEQAGILDPEARKQWTHDFYVPFYRVMEGEKAVSPGAAVTGLVRQKAFERLKGGTEPLGDLLTNTLSNWSHLLAASMKNLAASRAMAAATDMGIATPATSSDKGTVWIMEGGKQKHYTVSDPLVFDALTMLHHPGWNNPAMKAMQWFKRALTTGVTADPAFRIRNLMRDTVSAIASNRVGYNPLRNLVDGWKATGHGSDTYLRLLGGGGAIRFGTLLDGDQAANAKRLVQSGIATEGQILDAPAKVKAAFARAWDRWQELGDRMETVNRAVAYQQARAEGKTHLEASYAARDLLDFTMGGKWPAVRFLTQVVPFMNARLQGIYKLGRSAKEDPRRFAAVTGAVAMSSVLLHLLNSDDEEYQALPDWVRDTYWWVKLPGTKQAIFIPKPFEIGALGSVAERATELMTGGDDYTARDFGSTLLSILNDQLAMNPVPQAFRPLMEAAFNRNSFQNRPIDGMGQERLPPADRYTARTSAGAIAAGKALNVSPQRIEHMVRGYFGWLGSQALAVSDLAGRSLFDMPANPAHDFSQPGNLAVVGAFVRPAQGSGSKYVNRYYAQLGEVEQLYAAYSAARKAGDIERAAELYGDDRLRLRGLYRAADRQMRSVNLRIRRVTGDRTLTAHEKAELLAGLYETRDRVAKWTTEEARRR